MMKYYVGLTVATIGAKIWQLAYGKERFERYETLRWYEKVGHNMMLKGLAILDVSAEEQFEIFKKLNNKIWESEES